ncbi:MAG: MurR/RpiR family transcriptional regulator [Ruminococcaceae bacterium]|nr:MurR/RpiR family transcriptional regulator [Oscillospiraceae bacterium]
MHRDFLRSLENPPKRMSKSHRLIADYVAENYEKAAYMTAAKLGAAVGVSESTVVRFAIECGFEGYPEFSRRLQELIPSRLTSAQRAEVTNLRLGDGDILDKVLTSDIEKIKNTMAQVDRDAFYKAADAIINSRTIYIMGVRSSSAPAGFMSYYFSLIFDNVRLVSSTTGSEMFEQVFKASEGDVVIGISFPRYSKRVVHAMEYAKSKGACLIALTDSEESPIARLADYTLLAKSDMASFADSLVAPMSIINALIVTIGKKKNEYIQRVFTELEAIWDEHDVYEKNNE